MAESKNFDILVLGEVGKFDTRTINHALPEFKLFYQEGENASGGVLILVRDRIRVSRILCVLSNICVLDIHMNEVVRLIGMYAPASKTWDWDDLSPFTSNTCMLMGDFNVDLDQDGEKAERLLEWADSRSLSAITPGCSTSLRSDREIDYAIVAGVQIDVQTYERNTTSDHKPLCCILSYEDSSNNFGSITHWNVLYCCMEYMYKYWEDRWSDGNYNENYNKFNEFLGLMVGRCTRYFSIQKGSGAIPADLRERLSYSLSSVVQSLSFRAKRTGDIRLRAESAKIRNAVRSDLRIFRQNQLAKQLVERHKPGRSFVMFWNKTKKHFRNCSSSIRGFILPNGDLEKDPVKMVEQAADYYEELFAEPTVHRPHPYVDLPHHQYDD
ncbi:unnamed protein product, partial [Didymodactylos carnosus]